MTFHPRPWHNAAFLEPQRAWRDLWPSRDPFTEWHFASKQPCNILQLATETKIFQNPLGSWKFSGNSWTYDDLWWLMSSHRRLRCFGVFVGVPPQGRLAARIEGLGPTSWWLAWWRDAPGELFLLGFFFDLLSLYLSCPLENFLFFAKRRDAHSMQIKKHLKTVSS